MKGEGSFGSGIQEIIFIFIIYLFSLDGFWWVEKKI